MKKVLVVMPFEEAHKQAVSQIGKNFEFTYTTIKDAPRCIITPHSAGKFHLQETFERIVRITCGNMEKFLAGDTEHMRNLVEPATGYCRK